MPSTHPANDIIYCVGDSHISFFAGANKIQPLWPRPSKDLIPFFRTFRIGAVLAWSLGGWGSKNRGREICAALLDRGVPESEKQIPPGSRVLLSFGEIDCRCHVVAQAAKTNSSIETVVNRLAERYCGFIEEVASWGYRPIIWNVIPSSPDETGGTRDYPIVGTCRQRNEATRLINGILEAWCADKGFEFVNVYRHLVDSEGRTLPEMFMDPIHLSQAAMPNVIDWVSQTYSSLVPKNFDLSAAVEKEFHVGQGYEPVFPNQRGGKLKKRLARLFRSR